MNYRATHVSVHDGSDAMEISRDESAGTITLVNEDGYEWTDPLADWEAL